MNSVCEKKYFGGAKSFSLKEFQAFTSFDGFPTMFCETQPNLFPQEKLQRKLTVFHFLTSKFSQKKLKNASKTTLQRSSDFEKRVKHWREYEKNHCKTRIKNSSNSQQLEAIDSKITNFCLSMLTDKDTSKRRSNELVHDCPIQQLNCLKKLSTLNKKKYLVEGETQIER